MNGKVNYRLIIRNKTMFEETEELEVETSSPEIPLETVPEEEEEDKEDED